MFFKEWLQLLSERLLAKMVNLEEFVKKKMWWYFGWAISNPKRWCYESSALNMPANLENSAMATGLEKVHFHSNP